MLAGVFFKYTSFYITNIKHYLESFYFRIDRKMKYISYINKLQGEQDRGFTLIELLVVVLLLGILATIALPSFTRQIGKARETDAKNNLGIIARSQQAYHFEKRSFANDLNNLNIAGIDNSNYYSYPNPTVANINLVKHQAIASNPSVDIIKNYSLGVYHIAGLFDIAICQGIDINQAVNVGNAVNDNCTNNGIKLK